MEVGLTVGTTSNHNYPDLNHFLSKGCLPLHITWKHRKFLPNQFLLVDCFEWKIMHLPLSSNFCDLSSKFSVNRYLKINTHAYPHMLFLRKACTDT